MSTNVSAYIYALYHAGNFDRLFEVIGRSRFDERYYKELQEIWYKARYKEVGHRKRKLPMRIQRHVSVIDLASLSTSWHRIRSVPCYHEALIFSDIPVVRHLQVLKVEFTNFSQNVAISEGESPSHQTKPAAGKCAAISLSLTGRICSNGGI